MVRAAIWNSVRYGLATGILGLALTGCASSGAGRRDIEHSEYAGETARYMVEVGVTHLEGVKEPLPPDCRSISVEIDAKPGYDGEDAVSHATLTDWDCDGFFDDIEFGESAERDRYVRGPSRLQSMREDAWDAAAVAVRDGVEDRYRPEAGDATVDDMEGGERYGV